MIGPIPAGAAAAMAASSVTRRGSNVTRIGPDLAASEFVVVVIIGLLIGWVLLVVVDWLYDLSNGSEATLIGAFAKSLRFVGYALRREF